MKLLQLLHADIEYVDYKELKSIGLDCICDRCLDVDHKSTKIGFWDYLLRRKIIKTTQGIKLRVYCKDCWNYIRLGRYKCRNCGETGTNRTKNDKYRCGKCNYMIKLVRR